MNALVTKVLIRHLYCKKETATRKLSGLTPQYLKKKFRPPLFKIPVWGFLGGSDSKESACSVKDLGF